ncbi:RND family transporter [Desulfovibrio sp. JC022]|uniref:efflux RND transporter permease subunit n=1 Tax=Desulfovibrio sp. JC022 TaxID=2593642 RepID=UPI0013D0275D|nr:MMPL family transporter [Desulfovibrio sp. JC022]NDV23361.1 MMPL family transporter [Desulfovibrio sp. JC022]
MNQIKQMLISFATKRSWMTIAMLLLLAVFCGSFFPKVVIDTDPEHMLPPDEPSRVFHNQAKEKFALSEIVVLGILNEQNPHGVFNPDTLKRVHELAEFARTLRWENPDDPSKMDGVIEVDMIAPSMVEHISQDGPGAISFDWLMSRAPSTQSQADIVKEKVFSNPMLVGQMASEDGKAICIYLPLTDKYQSYRVYTALQEKIKELGGDDEYHITGLPVAQDAIGIEMFTEMSLASPLAMGTIFLLLYFFFRKLSLTFLPMIIATLSVVMTMGTMIGCGFEVHIMSSMIPVFLMSIAVVDSIHILSEFFDLYTPEKGRKQTIVEVLNILFMPMLYTSLTSAAGFISLALTPIPPVQIFGVFVGLGIMVAWLLTIMFVPAYILVLPARIFSNFGLSKHGSGKTTLLSRILEKTGGISYRYAKPLLGLFLILLVVSAWGISKIQINDNPVKWFAPSHPIRLADTALNRHFAGTYPAYLILESEENEINFSASDKRRLTEKFVNFTDTLTPEFPDAREKGVIFMAELMEKSDPAADSFLDRAAAFAGRKAEKSTGDDFYLYDEFSSFFSLEKELLKPFKQPAMLSYLAGLQKEIEKAGLVGKSTAPADLVSKIHQELTDGEDASYRVPEKMQTVGECYMQFQQSHRPHDLWHYVTPDYNGACVVFQLTSGDNMVMEAVETFVSDYFKSNPPPCDITHNWAGLTYINVAWQSQMVEGMLRSFIGSFAIVLLMAVFLFRSFKWGVLCMVPLTITIAFIYGFIGLIGKDYDMPVAVLGVLTLGMSVDFAIHFVERSRKIYSKTGSWKKTLPRMYGAPARAISRNVLVIAIGFLPMLISALIPYRTTSLLLSSIMMISGILTLVAMPAIITVASRFFFAGAKLEIPAQSSSDATVTVKVNQ